MAFKKFNPKHAEHLDRPDRMQNVDFDRLFSDIGVLQGQIIADIGAGTGFFSVPLARAVGSHGKVFAVDMAQEMLDRINAKVVEHGLENIVPVLSSEDRIDIGDSTVDLVFTSSVFHEMRGQGTLNEIRRILKPGGRFIVIDWKKKSKGGPPGFIKKTEGQVIKKCGKSGLEHTGDFETGMPNKYGLIFQKP